MTHIRKRLSPEEIFNAKIARKKILKNLKEKEFQEQKELFFNTIKNDFIELSCNDGFTNCYYKIENNVFYFSFIKKYEIHSLKIKFNEIEKLLFYKTKDDKKYYSLTTKYGEKHEIIVDENLEKKLLKKTLLEEKIETLIL